MILRRYLATQLFKGWLMVLLVLGAVLGLMSFIEELDRTRFDYDGVAVARYTLLALPQRLVEQAPVIALLGSLVALTRLCLSNELTVISGAGVSLRKLLIAVAMPTLVLMSCLWLSMEYLTPRLLQSAESQRYALRFRNEVRIPDGGIWGINGRRYTRVGKLFAGGVPGDINVFEFDGEGRLLLALHARTASIGPQRRWQLQNVREKRLIDGEFRTRGLKTVEIENLWTVDELPSLKLTSDAMALSVLYRYSQFVAGNDELSRGHYSAVFWKKLLMPFTVGAMVLLATPIAANIGTARNRSFGVHMAIGALIGILFHVGAQIMFALGHLLQLQPVIIALLPVSAVLLCALVLLRRMRW